MNGKISNEFRRCDLSTVRRAPQNLSGKLSGYLTIFADHFAVNDRIVHANGSLDQSSGFSRIIVRPFRLTRVNRIGIKDCEIGRVTGLD